MIQTSICFKLLVIRSCIVFYISKPCIIVKLTALLFISSAVSCNWWQDLMIWWKIIRKVQLKIKRKCVWIYSLCPTDDQHHLWCKFYTELNFLTRLISHKSASHVPFCSITLWRWWILIKKIMKTFCICMKYI